MRPIQKAKATTTLPEHGTPLKIKNKITPKEKCVGFFVKQQYLDCRRSGEDAVYYGWVPGAGGDVWWVQHQDGTIGAYMFDELTDRRGKKS